MPTSHNPVVRRSRSCLFRISFFDDDKKARRVNRSPWDSRFKSWRRRFGSLASPLWLGVNRRDQKAGLELSFQNPAKFFFKNFDAQSAKLLSAAFFLPGRAHCGSAWPTGDIPQGRGSDEACTLVQAMPSAQAWWSQALLILSPPSAPTRPARTSSS